MAVVNYADANAYSLADLALNSNNPAVKFTAFQMLKASSLFSYVPIVTDPTFKVNGTQVTGDIPSPNWTDLNGGTLISPPIDPEWWNEAFYMHSDAVQVNRYSLMEKNQISDPFELQWKAKIMGIAFDRNYRLIQGKHASTVSNDPRVNKKAFVGIRERLDNPQLYRTNPECLINGGGLNLGSAGTAADGWNLEYMVDALFDAMNSPDGTDIIMTANAKAMRSFDRAIKKAGGGGGFRYDKDAFDRTVTMYKNATIMNCGRQKPTGPKANRLQIPIISETENAAGTLDTGGTFTSIYAFRVGEDALYGWQFEDMAPTEPVLLFDGNTMQSTLTHGIGIACPDPRALGRIYNVSVDADGTN